MGDTNCTRHGYDSTERYHVPVNDQCDECRCAPGESHNDQCPTLNINVGPNEYVEPEYRTTIDIDDIISIPLDIQEHIFRQGVDYASLDLERMLLQDWEEIKDLALERLRGGFSEFGCEMFAWSAETRRQNVLEEIADSLVYLISGPTDV